MLKVRIISCLDVKDGRVVKGIRFSDHRDAGNILDLAQQYCDAGADELVFYDITASCERRTVERQWIRKIAQRINIPFCVAGGIRSIADASAILSAGADKISINAPALENPDLINQLAERFGKQCVVIGIDSMKINKNYCVYQYTGDATKSQRTDRNTLAWAREVALRGAGEIVLNCMNQDGTRQGYDIEQTSQVASSVRIPVIASGGAGGVNDFQSVFQLTSVSGALAASVFHDHVISIAALKQHLRNSGVPVR